MSDERNKSTNVVWQETIIDRSQRESQNGHKSTILWFTGLSGSGKSTLAHAVEDRLHKMNCRTTVLDGDNIRHGLCGDLGFSDEARVENIRRIGEVAKLFLDAGVIALTAFISPFIADRNRVRNLVEDGDFVEIFCRCSLDTCEQRDVKGLYKKARSGEIKEFTGISSPYEEPVNPEILVDTDKLALDECVDKVIQYLTEKEIISNS